MDDIDRTTDGRPAGAAGAQPAQPQAPDAAETTPGAPAPGEASSAGREPQPADGAAELAGDLDELVKVAAQRDEYLALAQRTQADFENYRKRVARDVAGAQERGAASLAKELLPALDNLDRALEAAQEANPWPNAGRPVAPSW